MLIYRSIGVLICLIVVHCSEIDLVDDNDLVHLLTGEQNVIALFTKNDCADCVHYEKAVSNVQSELKQTLGAVIVKAHNSNLVSIYDPSREPALIYFRLGIPLLYYGEVGEDSIVRFFSDNRDPVVKELNDENFEHLTQASTGATTGDWFVFFYSADCVLCQRLYAVWESVGGALRRRLNVARVNRLEAGISTAKRLGVLSSPEFILLRRGKLYRYSSKDYSPKAFIEFVESGYSEQTHPEIVPVPKSLMSEYFSQYKSFEVLSLVVIALLIVSVFTYTVKRVIGSTNKKSATKKTK